MGWGPELPKGPWRSDDPHRAQEFGVKTFTAGDSLLLGLKSSERPTRVQVCWAQIYWRGPWIVNSRLFINRALGWKWSSVVGDPADDLVKWSHWCSKTSEASGLDQKSSIVGSKLTELQRAAAIEAISLRKAPQDRVRVEGEEVTRQPHEWERDGFAFRSDDPPDEKSRTNQSQIRQ